MALRGTHYTPTGTSRRSVGMHQQYAGGVPVSRTSAPQQVVGSVQQQGGGTNATQDLIADWQSQYDQARAANVARGEEILGGYQQRYDNAMEMLTGLGESERAGIETRYQNLGTSAQQDLVSRGLRSTTIAPSVAAGIEQQKTQALGGLEERLRRERLGYQTQLSGDRLAFQERINETYPDQSGLRQLLQQYGQAQGRIDGGGGSRSYSYTTGGSRTARGNTTPSWVTERSLDSGGNRTSGSSSSIRGYGSTSSGIRPFSGTGSTNRPNANRPRRTVAENTARGNARSAALAEDIYNFNSQSGRTPQAQGIIGRGGYAASNRVIAPDMVGGQYFPFQGTPRRYSRA